MKLCVSFIKLKLKKKKSACILKSCVSVPDYQIEATTFSKTNRMENSMGVDGAQMKDGREDRYSDPRHDQVYLPP